ncbi:MAG: hypothetical protein Ctma_1399 [Catillopecten margaritatus gill symbiont]|uniref:DUF4760 domain-containing protein n=1 Tax=Catillopecten margaritatus gill symbiont TaxID=3083288 RepID=A0AAU6PI23_9GAMM
MDLSNQEIFQIIQTATLIVAVFVAWCSINKQRDTTKKDKTISLLMKDLEDDFLKSGMQTLLKVHNNEDDDVAIYANSAHKNDENAIAIRNLLNYYENISVGVGSNIYDVEMIKKSQKTMILSIYKQSKPFITRLREQNKNPNLYIEFERFVEILNG